MIVRTIALSVVLTITVLAQGRIPEDDRYTELEGRITSDDPLPAPRRLSISVGGPHGEFNRWTAPVDAEGRYRVAIGDVTADTLIFVRAQAASADGDLTSVALHSVFLRTAG